MCGEQIETGRESDMELRVTETKVSDVIAYLGTASIMDDTISHNLGSVLLQKVVFPLCSMEESKRGR